MNCPRCSTSNTPDAVFCRGCGEKLQAKNSPPFGIALSYFSKDPTLILAAVIFLICALLKLVSDIAAIDTPMTPVTVIPIFIKAVGALVKILPLVFASLGLLRFRSVAKYEDPSRGTGLLYASAITGEVLLYLSLLAIAVQWGDTPIISNGTAALPPLYLADVLLSLLFGFAAIPFYITLVSTLAATRRSAKTGLCRVKVNAYAVIYLFLLAAARLIGAIAVMSISGPLEFISLLFSGAAALVGGILLVLYKKEINFFKKLITAAE